MIWIESTIILPQENRMTSQETLSQAQALYREWLKLQPELEAAEQTWQRSAEIMRQLQVFYFNGAYADLRQREENGEPLDTRTEGEYSVLSEDAIWNAVHEHQALAWQRVRSSLKILDPDNQV